MCIKRQIAKTNLIFGLAKYTRARRKSNIVPARSGIRRGFNKSARVEDICTTTSRQAIFAKTTPVNAKTVRVSYRKSSYGAATKIQIVRTIKANTSGAHGRNDSFRLGCLIVPFLQASTTFLTEITYVKAF